jgi:hypothetical protein
MCLFKSKLFKNTPVDTWFCNVLYLNIMIISRRLADVGWQVVKVQPLKAVFHVEALNSNPVGLFIFIQEWQGLLMLI